MITESQIDKTISKMLFEFQTFAGIYKISSPGRVLICMNEMIDHFRLMHDNLIRFCSVSELESIGYYSNKKGDLTNEH